MAREGGWGQRGLACGCTEGRLLCLCRGMPAMRAFGQVGPCGRCAGSMRILGRVRVCCCLTVSGLVSVTCEFEIIAWVRVFRL